MDNLATLKRIRELYDQGGNIAEHLRQAEGKTQNATEDILISYEFQAGSYTKKYDAETPRYEAYAKELTDELKQLPAADSILEAGCGEATWLALVTKQLDQKPRHVLGFDLSLSRVRCAREFFSRINPSLEPRLCTGDLFSMPLADNSVDIVYTSHALESNGGREREALTELYRVARKYVVLLEPAYELAGEEGKERMRRFGYITGLQDAIQELGYRIVKHRPFEASFNPLNPTALTIIEKTPSAPEASDPQFVCPVTHAPLTMVKDAWYAKESMLAYPIVDGIPCLQPGNAIIAVNLKEDS